MSTVIHKVSMDNGYGKPKGQVNDGELFQFPAAIASRSISYASAGNTVYETYEGGEWLVGEDAVGDELVTRDFAFQKTYTPLFIMHLLRLAKVQLDPIMYLDLRVGLSIVDYKHMQEYIDSLKSFEVSGIQFICKVTCNIQGEGAYRGFVLSEKRIYPTVCIIDNGYNTLDIIWFKNNKYNNELSTALPGHGVCKIVLEVQNALNAKYRLSLTEAEINNYLINYLQHKSVPTCNGVPMDIFENTVMTATKNYLTMLLRNIFTKYDKHMKLADKIVFCGGGTYYLEKMKNLPANVVTSGKPYEFANVIGYNIGNKATLDDFK